MQHLEQVIDSREVAEMMGKEHSKLLRDIRRYVQHFTEAKIGFSEFWAESTYPDTTGRILPCYKITKKGCEFIAHKMTGTKGTIFTARYINRFHDMEFVPVTEHGHSFEREVVLEPSVGMTGICSYTCQYCGASYSETIPALKG